MNNSKQYFNKEQIIGRWHAKRLILDRNDLSVGRYDGEMNISLNMDATKNNKASNAQNLFQLDFTEVGIFKKNDLKYAFSQAYRAEVSTNEFKVLFSNGLPFFTVNKKSNSQEINHFCKSDQYNGKIIFTTQTAFWVYFNVVGPKKNYYLKALYKRYL